MQTTTKKRVFVLRRSENTNSFGLRGIWVIETDVTKTEGRDYHRVFSFAVNHLDADTFQPGAVVNAAYISIAQQGHQSDRPAYELCKMQYRVLSANTFAFVEFVNAALAEVGL